MPNQQAVDERPDPPIQEPELNTESIQSNILPGFNKDFQMLLFLKITNVEKFKYWLHDMVPSITTMDQVLDFRCRLKKGRIMDKKGPLSERTWDRIWARACTNPTFREDVEVSPRNAVKRYLGDFVDPLSDPEKNKKMKYYSHVGNCWRESTRGKSWVLGGGSGVRFEPLTLRQDIR